MKTYIGTKIIEAVPAVRKGGRVYEEGQPTPKSMDPVEEGYKVRYPDGYESFSPKAVFEKAYLELTTNPNLRTSKPSISQEMRYRPWAAKLPLSAPRFGTASSL